MNSATIVKTLAIMAVCTGVLAGCMPKETSNSIDISNDVQAPIDNSDVPAAEPTLSMSTDTTDLKKELDETTLPDEDFSDL